MLYIPFYSIGILYDTQKYSYAINQSIIIIYIMYVYIYSIIYTCISCISMYSIICMIDVAWTFGPSGCAWAGPGPGKMEAPADVRSAWWPCTAHDSERRCGDVWIHRIHRIRAAGNNMNSTCNSEMAVSSNKVAKDEEIWYIWWRICSLGSAQFLDPTSICWPVHVQHVELAHLETRLLHVSANLT